MDTPIFEKKNVLVTGGAGFIGSHLCERLLKEAKVICLDDFSNSGPQNINHLLQYPDFEFIKFDVNESFDPDKFPELQKFKVKFQGIQEIYHLACPTSPKRFDEFKTTTLKSNSVGVLKTLDLAVRFKAKYVLGSSAVVYGDTSSTPVPFKEADLGLVDQLSGRACYDEGKRFAETCVSTYNQVYGLDAKIARIFTTYGPHMSLFEGQLIPGFVINALDNQDMIIYGDESFATTLCYVTDMVDGLVRFMGSDPNVKVVNLGGDRAIKYIEVATEIVKLIGSSSKVVFEEPLSFLSKKGSPDLSMAKDKLGWLPLVRLPDGLQKMIDYIIANREALGLSGYNKGS